MSRYIDARQIRYCWMFDADGTEHDGVTLHSVIDKVPTADVVPRSEVERIFGEFEADAFITQCGTDAPCLTIPEKTYIELKKKYGVPYNEDNEVSFQEDLEFFVNDCTRAQLKVLHERVEEKLKETGAFLVKDDIASPEGDTADEIFSDVEKTIREHIESIRSLNPQNSFCGGGTTALELALKSIGELRKKYIGEK